jgi:exopolyphosphatase/guanosine-5'-triphosphate,3'-diphosphate pyrophosphatase
MSAPEHRPSHSDAAVIDVGSNSVRLVLYRVDGRAIWSVFNEKVLAGLGRDLTRTGRLSPDGVTATLLALARFRALVDASRPRRVFAAATAAVRDALDGGAFRERVERETGFQLQVLSGEDEARYSALGVVAGAPDATGLVGDLGGASLELVRLDRGQPQRGVTLPLGPFSVDARSRFDAAAIRSTAVRHLAPIDRGFRADTLHAVGGAWRNLALLNMKITHYPLSIVHQYAMGRREILDAARFISQQSRASLERIEGLSKRRIEALPHAAIVLETIVEQLDVQRVVMSAHGLREGLLWEAMGPDVRECDPLVAGCAALGSRQPVAEALGRSLESWAGPAFSKLEPVFGARDQVLLAAVARLAELGAQLHPDHRADLVFHQVLRAPIAGVEHPERAFLACAAFARHTSASQVPDAALVERLLTPEGRQRALALGAAMRLGCELSGRSPELLSRTRLDIKAGVVVLQAEEAWAPLLLGDQTTKRAQTLADLLDRDLKLRTMAPRARAFEVVD